MLFLPLSFSLSLLGACAVWAEIQESCCPGGSGGCSERLLWLQSRLAFCSFSKIGFLHLVSCLCAASSRWPSKRLANLAIQVSAVLQPKASRAFEVSSHNVGIGSDLKGIALFHFKGYQSILGPFGTKSVPCGFVCEMRDYPNRLERWGSQHRYFFLEQRPPFIMPCSRIASKFRGKNRALGITNSFM